ncbi:MAG: GntR family transcriptional regulator [Rhizobiaceae bacterium]|nr:GntR family transcriptional regulator [Rhizobiaceae bacterium]
MTASDQPVERGRGAGSRGSQVYRALLERIRCGELEPGTRMREEDVAKLLDVSRTPVREALGRLQARGLIENANGGLAIVKLNRPQAMELYAMRANLEGAAARFAAENASAGEVAGLKHVCGLFSNYQGNATDFAKVNKVFHEAIYEATHNRYLIKMLEDLNDSLALLRDTTFSVPGRAEAAKIEHENIYKAIEKGNADQAEQAARLHIDNARNARLQLLFAID